MTKFRCLFTEILYGSVQIPTQILNMTHNRTYEKLDKKSAGLKKIWTAKYENLHNFHILLNSTLL